MKIEKISDNQIKCTLNKSDLAARQIKLSELAYGSEKAKSLFRDMMQQAAHEFGFEAEDIPLMIEAIPVSSDCIILLVTKVEDPEELDTRFSRFAPSADDIEEIDSDNKSNATVGLLDMFNHVKNEIKEAMAKGDDKFIPLPDALKNAGKVATGISNNTDNNPHVSTSKGNNKSESCEQKNFTKIFSFTKLDNLIDVSSLVNGIYNGPNSLYKSDDTYYLIVSLGNHSNEDFNRVCNILLEYGSLERGASDLEAFIKEHYSPIIKRKALQKLSTVNNN